MQLRCMFETGTLLCFTSCMIITTKHLPFPQNFDVKVLYEVSTEYLILVYTGSLLALTLVY